MNYRMSGLTYVFLFSCLFLVLQLPTVVLSEDLTGEVVGIDGNQVTVKLSTEKIPRSGDPITLFLDHPDLGEMTIGQWQVTTVHYPMVEAQLVEATGEAEIGVRAVIVSKNPQPAIFNKPAPQKKIIPLAKVKPEKKKTSVADKALLRAVLDKSLSGVKKALKDGAAVNRIILEGSTILFAAVEMKNLEIIKYLLANGADPSIEDDFGVTALMSVPVLGGEREVETITAFHEAGVSLNSPTSTGMTLLHAASKGWSSPETVSYLLNTGAEVNAQLKISPQIEQPEWQGYTSLIFAVTNLDEKKVNLLLAAGADPDLKSSAGKTAIELLLEREKSGLSLRKDFQGKRYPLTENEKGTIQSLKVILANSKVAQNKAQNELQKQMLRHIKANDLGSVMRLINLGVDPNGSVDGVPLLTHAVKDGSREMVMAFLNHGADPLQPSVFGTRKASTPLMVAIFSNNLPLVKLFLEKGADPNDIPWKIRGKGILHEYINADTPALLETILTLIKGGSDPNWRDKDGNTPLHIAAERGNEVVFNALLQAGANPNAINFNRQEPIDLARASFLPGFDRRVRTKENIKKIRAAQGEKNWPLVTKIAGQLIKNGEPYGYLILGDMAKHGKGRTVNLAEASKYFTKGAEAGSMYCMYSLGTSYEHGHGVPKSGAKAAYWYEKAAALGSVYAQRDLGILYLNGNGVEKDDKLAFKWIKRAAVQGMGNKKAIFYLGKLCEQGIGTPVNLKMTKELYEEAAAKGYAGGDTGIQTRPPRQHSTIEYPDTPLTVAKAFLEAFFAGDVTSAARYIAPAEREKALQSYLAEPGKDLSMYTVKQFTFHKIVPRGDKATLIAITPWGTKPEKVGEMIRVDGKWYVTFGGSPKKENGKQPVQEQPFTSSKQNLWEAVNSELIRLYYIPSELTKLTAEEMQDALKLCFLSSGISFDRDAKGDYLINEKLLYTLQKISE